MSRFTLQNEEYSRLDFFNELSNYKPDETLLKYKRNVILLSGFVLFYCIAGIEIEKFSGVFVQGKIDNPNIIIIFAVLFLIYNYYMFTLLYNKLKSSISFKYDLEKYARSLISFIIVKNIKEVQPKGFDKSTIIEPELNFEKGKNNYKVEIHNDKTYIPHIIQRVSSSGQSEDWKKYYAIEGKENILCFNYSLSEKDISYFDKKKKDIFNVIKFNRMEYKFPTYLFTVSLVYAAGYALYCWYKLC